MSRFGAFFKPEVEINATSLRVTLKRNNQPDFKRSFTDSCRVSMLAIFPDFIKMKAHDESCRADVVFMKNVVFDFTIQVEAVYYLLMLKIEGTAKGEINDNTTIKAMPIIDAGAIV